MKQSNNEIRERTVTDILKYFSIFKYSPTFEEIHTFLKKKTSKRALASILQTIEKKSLIKVHFRHNSLRSERNKVFMKFLTSNVKHLTSYTDSPHRYTLPQYSNKMNVKLQMSNFKLKSRISQQKIEKVLPYIRMLSRFPQFKLIGLSGSVAMLNAEEDHDVDLFIITAKNRMFTARFIALFLVQVMGIRRPRPSGATERSGATRLLSQAKRCGQVESKKILSSLQHSSLLQDDKSVSNKVCLNLFFDESNLSVPKFKRSEYTAHEVLQVKSLEQRDDTYSRFIDANRWVFDIFPNAQFYVKTQIPNLKSQQNLKSQVQIPKKNSFGLWIWNLIGNLDFVIWIFNKIESLLKSFQLRLISRHQTTEIITTTQLWFHPAKPGFHPDDFEKDIKSNIQ